MLLFDRNERFLSVTGKTKVLSLQQRCQFYIVLKYTLNACNITITLFSSYTKHEIFCRTWCEQCSGTSSVLNPEHTVKQCTLQVLITIKLRLSSKWFRASNNIMYKSLCTMFRTIIQQEQLAIIYNIIYQDFKSELTQYKDTHKTQN